MKEMLILVGPQGAGNHLWSKVLSMHAEVFGWKSLLDNYWEAHRFNEPFCKEWKNHSLLKEFDWEQSNYYITSISCPLGIPNSDINPLWIPDIAKFAKEVTKCNVNVKIAVVGRDQNILKLQQERVRTTPTLPSFMEQLPELHNPIFLSYELLYLYKEYYLRSLNLNIPISNDYSLLNKILENDANERYVSQATPSLDMHNITGTILKEKK